VNKLTSLTWKTLGRLLYFAGQDRSWANLEYFDETWKSRIQEMARFIRPGESVIDLGCGMMWLRPYLKDNVYHPVDYRRRDESTIVLDFNNHQFPPITTDVAFLSGTLEYIRDYEWFVNQVSRHCTRCIVSYCTTENYPDLNTRKNKAWQSHLTRAQLITLFTKNGMHLETESNQITHNPIFVFSKGDTLPSVIGSGQTGEDIKNTLTGQTIACHEVESVTAHKLC